MKYCYQKHYNTENRYETRVLAALLALVLAIGFITGSIILKASAEANTVTAWVMCQPGDWVNARVRGSRSSMSIGMLETGHPVEVTGKTEHGYAQCIKTGLENDEAWIHSGYLVFDEPKWSGAEAEVVCKGVVLCRKYVDGPVRKRLAGGSIVQIFWKTDEWCVTNYGFIKTEYLEEL